MNVVCVRTGTKYGPPYVSRLYEGLMRHTTKPFDFHVRQQAEFPGWWQKVLLFPPEERTIFLDLDVVITGNVDFLFDYDGPFAIWGDPWNGAWNSSVMSIAPGFGTIIRDRFLANPESIMARFASDQEFLFAALEGHADLWQTIAPKAIQSYKADALEDGPKAAAICVFHGLPKPHELSNWVQEAWR